MKLEEYLKEKKLSTTKFCQLIDYHITYISRIMNGKTFAGRKLAKKIENFTNGEVKAESLMQPKVKDELV